MAWRRAGLARDVTQDDDITQAGDIEGAAGAFLDHVGIQAFRAHQRDTPVERLALIVQARKLIAQVGFLGFQVLKSVVAVVAFNGVEPK